MENLKTIAVKAVMSNGLTEDGKERKRTLYLKNINPDVSTEDMNMVSKAIFDLQKLPVIGLYRVQTDRISD